MPNFKTESFNLQIYFDWVDLTMSLEMSFSHDNFYPGCKAMNLQREDLDWIFALLFICDMNLDTCLNGSEPQFSICKMEITILTPGLPCRLK